MKTVQAFAPANISLLFKVVPHEDPARMGSLGCGFTVNEGVTVTVKRDSGNPKDSRNQTVILFNSTPLNFPTVTSVVNRLTRSDLVIDIRSRLPLGSGFGISGASALATAYAVNQLLSLNKSSLELAKLAHTAEVENKTGLGDVINQYFGGFFVKFVSSSQFIAKRIPINNIPVYCVSYGKLLTSSILNNPTIVKEINGAADTALAQIKQLLHAPALTFPDILAGAKQFAKESSLLTSPSIMNMIREIEARGGHASMIMLGEALVADIPFEGAIKLIISSTPAHLL